MKRILLVDDEKALTEALSTKLQTAGFEVEVAENGQQALDKVAQSKFDLILLDIIMPVMDGMTVLRRLKVTDETKNIPVIILTNLSDDEKIEEAAAVGRSDYLIKTDYSLDDVLGAVKRRLQI